MIVYKRGWLAGSKFIACHSLNKWIPNYRVVILEIICHPENLQIISKPIKPEATHAFVVKFCCQFYDKLYYQAPHM
jgi:hypothetical protein